MGLAGPVSATTIVKHYDFTMNYHQGEFSKIWGGFDATYDATGGAIAVKNFWSNLPSAYTATAGSAYNNILTLGTNCDEHGCSVTSGQDEFSFVFVIDPTGDVIYPYSFVYARAQEYALFEGRSYRPEDQSDGSIDSGCTGTGIVGDDDRGCRHCRSRGTPPPDHRRADDLRELKSPEPLVRSFDLTSEPADATLHQRICLAPKSIHRSREYRA